MVESTSKMSSLPEIIRKKRDGEELSKADMQIFIEQTAAGTAQQCQIGIYYRTNRE